MGAVLWQLRRNQTSWQMLLSQGLMMPHVMQLFVCVGILVAFVIGLPYDGKEATVQLLGHDTAWWRVMFAVGVIPAAMQVCLLAPACGCFIMRMHLHKYIVPHQSPSTRQQLHAVAAELWLKRITSSMIVFFSFQLRLWG